MLQSRKLFIISIFKFRSRKIVLVFSLGNYLFGTVKETFYLVQSRKLFICYSQGNYLFGTVKATIFSGYSQGIYLSVVVKETIICLSQGKHF